MKKPSSSSKNSGFSLIEMMIVLTVISISLGSGPMLYGQYADKSRIDQTNIKLEEIMKAINEYADKYNRLPCPADATVQFGDPNFGIGTYSSGSCQTENLSGSNVVMGMVPVSTLNLYPSLAVDAWGNRITYAIKEDAAATNGMDVSVPIGNVELPLLNYSGSTSYSGVVVIVFSHGENGFGAWRGRGGTARIDATGGISQEDDNNTPGGDFYISSSTGIANFDDMMYIWSRDQIKDDGME